MLLARALADVRGRRARACAVGLLLVLIALLPLAHASPPDPLWIAGIYDDADFDEVVVAVVSAIGLVESPALLARPAEIAAGTVQPPVVVLAAVASSSIFNVRAPPA